jgi:hypothetical protein
MTCVGKVRELALPRTTTSCFPIFWRNILHEAGGQYICFGEGYDTAAKTTICKEHMPFFVFVGTSL